MKKRSKFLASMLALVLCFGVIGLPAFKGLFASAVSATISTETLEILKVDKNYMVYNSEDTYGIGV